MGIDDKAPDSEPQTPVASPEARRRRSSAKLEQLVKCPACGGVAGVLCTYCYNSTVDGPTRYVTQERAKEWQLAHADTDPPKEPER